MTSTVTNTTTTSPDKKQPSPLVNDGLLSLIAFLLLEFLCFGLILNRIGFYMDDWSMYSNLHFGPKNFIDLTIECLKDPKVIIRPLEGPYFAALFTWFGGSPFGHHLVNALFEAFGAWFLYLGLHRVCHNKRFAFLASAIFLLYPNHDATHYWITASSATVSLTLYTLSFWQAVKGFQEKRISLVFLSAFSFLLSVFNYESFLPLFPFTFVCCLFIALDNNAKKAKAALQTALYFSPYVIITVITWWYRRVFLPLVLPGSWTPAAGFDINHIVTVYREGFNDNLLLPAATFFVEQANKAIAAGVSPIEWLFFALALLTTAATPFLLAKSETEIKPITFAKLVVAGLITILSSYSIYGLALTYVPLLDTIINRINAGATIGSAMIIASVIFLLSQTFGRANGLAKTILPAILGGFLVGLFVLSNWGLSKPWIASWGVQKQIRSIIENKRASFKSGDTIVLANAPRYVMWAPLFDGVWDFQTMVRWCLNNKDINGCVVSERIVLSKDDARDISRGYLCGTYPYKTMHLLTPGPETWYEVPSGEAFISIIENHGMHFGLDKTMPAKWRTQLSTK
jgi:hypothetical protein